ncbi:response regulator transcription factor [Marinibacterium profundimaris]|uniref:Chemotaxis protein CheY n=1 Tax=Marinibacterium profundimaris TaxID=1679460 RepID=A0A225NFB0_9RHOB|nr:response regulator [Marinibacterium profundimaris]OWU71697.1 chemotaxis protein CheY [Marinibacterium profundimaris]
MKVLIVESKSELGSMWQRHLQRLGSEADLVRSQAAAIEALQESDYDILILDLVLSDGSSLSVADFANYRCPKARVIFVTNTTFFSDGSIFAHSPNACSYVPSGTSPEDLAAMAEHYAALR